ncbi:hypothetical protein, partial [Halalkalibacter lacteus]|uniref:hypothetical protein n=1 Tax=Halalkalibacter lacteus TaxID=3090663 RepID=UPI002FC9A4FD
LTASSSDYKRAQVMAAQVPPTGPVGGPNAPAIEAYVHAGAYAWPPADAGQRALTLVQQAIEARRQRWCGRSVVRSL